MKRSIMLCMLTLLTIGIGTSACQAQSKPNILVIWGDDIGWFNISAFNRGMIGYKTPNIKMVSGLDM